jgi:hypothetical protein
LSDIFRTFTSSICDMFTNHLFQFSFHHRRWTNLGLIFGQLTKLVKLWGCEKEKGIAESFLLTGTRDKIGTVYLPAVVIR